jgi:hypothetical protein
MCLCALRCIQQWRSQIDASAGRTIITLDGGMSIFILPKSILI